VIHRLQRNPEAWRRYNKLPRGFQEQYLTEALTVVHESLENQADPETALDLVLAEVSVALQAQQKLPGNLKENVRARARSLDR
jgi:hypothetical protein